MLNMIIADDNLVFIKNIYNKLIKKINKLHCIALVTTGKEAIQNIEKYQPEILLLDLEMPNGNGIEVINFINKYRYSTKVIVISAYIDKLYNNYDNILPKIEAILPKPLDINRLEEIINNTTYDNINNYVQNELGRFNFNKKSIGYKYLASTIIIVIQNNKIKFNLKNDIYKEVSRLYSISHENTIKWTIDKLIKQMCTNTSETLLCEYFHLQCSKKVTAKIIITTLFDNYNS